ncbi:hypothetical protein ACP4OV_019324 [Aristida adscensionis]
MGRTAVVCLCLVLLLLGSSIQLLANANSTSAISTTDDNENCSDHQFAKAVCIKFLCKETCLIFFGKHLRDYHCEGNFLQRYCRCHVCYGKDSKEA